MADGTIGTRVEIGQATTGAAPDSDITSSSGLSPRARQLDAAQTLRNKIATQNAAAFKDAPEEITTNNTIIPVDQVESTTSQPLPVSERPRYDNYDKLLETVRKSPISGRSPEEIARDAQRAVMHEQAKAISNEIHRDLAEARPKPKPGIGRRSGGATLPTARTRTSGILEPSSIQSLRTITENPTVEPVPSNTIDPTKPLSSRLGPPEQVQVRVSITPKDEQTTPAIVEPVIPSPVESKPKTTVVGEPRIVTNLAQPKEAIAEAERIARLSQKPLWKRILRVK